MMNTSLKFSLALIVNALLSTTLVAQITVDGSPTPEDLVQRILLGAGVEVKNIKATGADVARGEFFGDGLLSNFDLEHGIILTSGNIDNAPGPNIGINTSGDNGEPGDKDLDKLLKNGQKTQDASILEFDFIPATDTVSFRYIFASEEYPEYAGSQYNDVFGFLVSGPGITGKKNIALVPKKTIPVSVNNINATTNSQYYRDNNLGLTIEYDGLTTILTAWVVVIPCQTYHMKLAIADVSDGIYDTAVFLEANSFIAVNSAYLSATYPTADSIVKEGCVPMLVHFNRSKDLDKAYTMFYDIGGTAVNGEDFLIKGDSITFLPKQAQATLAITPIADHIPEGIETAYVRLKGIISCFDDSIGFRITDAEEVVAAVSPDTTICSGDQIMLVTSSSGGSGKQTYRWSDGQSGDAILVSPSASTLYTVLVEDTCVNVSIPLNCMVRVWEPMQVTIDVSQDSIQRGKSVIMEARASGGTGNYAYLWEPNIGEGPGPHTVTVKSDQDTVQYSVSVVDAGTPCKPGEGLVLLKVLDDYYFNIPNAFSPNNDSGNEVFKADGVGITNFSLSIFDRWGARVFETDDIDEGWNGGFNNDLQKMMPVGAYIYVAKVNNKEGNIKKFVGPVSLTR